MKKQINPNIQAYPLRTAFYVLLLVAMCAIPFALAQRNVTKPGTATELLQRTLSFEERVAYHTIPARIVGQPLTRSMHPLPESCTRQSGLTVG